MSPYRNSREHLFAELRRLDLVLNLAVARQRRDPVLAGFSEFRGLFISEDEINQLLAGAAARSEELALPDDAGTRKLQVDERILNYLLDVESPDARLAPFVSVVRPVADLQELLLPDVTAQALARLFRALAAAPADAGGRRPLRALFFHGPSGAGK